MSDPFDQALEAARNKRLQQSAAAKADDEARLLAKAERARAEREAFDDLVGVVASRDTAFEVFGFKRGEIVDADRGDYRITLKRENRVIAITRRGSGFNVYMWWDHIRNDGFIEPFNQTDVDSEDELMALLGGWIGEYGEEK